MQRDKHAVPLFTYADILPLNFLYKSVCCLMHYITIERYPVPIDLVKVNLRKTAVLNKI